MILNAQDENLYFSMYRNSSQMSIVLGSNVSTELRSHVM